VCLYGQNTDNPVFFSQSIGNTPRRTEGNPAVNRIGDDSMSEVSSEERDDGGGGNGGNRPSRSA
jgi:hypothetical protein